jgi:hypothetical protein
VLERFARLGQQRLRVVGSSSSRQPFPILELDDREVEGQLEGAEPGLGGGELAVGAGVVAGEVGAEAVGGRVEEGRAQTGR